MWTAPCTRTACGLWIQLPSLISSNTASPVHGLQLRFDDLRADRESGRGAVLLTGIVAVAVAVLAIAVLAVLGLTVVVAGTGVGARAAVVVGALGALTGTVVPVV